ncbi:hypothetical protein KMW28_13660 [Flammeovirga yaeyamensis]|uniref:Uncharacterized protein n=1 Tax=Flammeovirga yaeyamensis TaxID=367791 RepID=A0AAX1N459_9BACT|nr:MULTISPECIES: hypothetical protein [Flammeovirga]ANQ47895.1 hypothetical protein MY04_0513 [Flammeovirga sp. MY04]MBB3700941.1 hypothetical protein [Flammeovirga yaeyamensis]NMF38048.1 hypothetical protein [Flammeovirga yaeyamensis]QWG00698.1 hypothetical protein KMW28_13660 [Flammeovirga yaeyamensis]
MTQELLNYYDNSPLGVTIYKRLAPHKFEIYYYNEAGREMDGLSENETKGKLLETVFPNCEEIGLSQLLEKVYLDGKTQVIPFMGFKSDNTKTIHRTNRVQKLEEPYVVSVFSDESQTYSYIRQIEKDNRKLNHALDYTSHHLRGNLSTSLGILELFEATDVSREEKQFLLNVIKKNLENIDSKMHHLVDLLYKEVKEDEKILKKHKFKTFHLKNSRVS